MLHEAQAITIFLESDNEILIFLRSEHVSTYQGKWAGVSGSIDDDRTADEQAAVELEEETGLSGRDVELIRRGEPLVIHDEVFQVKKVIHPYLFHVIDRNKIRIDWEHKGIRWIKPAEIDLYETMPKLKETLAKVLPQ